jgi:hypothetical protein
MMERPSMPAEAPAVSTETGGGRAATTAADGTSGVDNADLARRAQFLATEHWSLLATRSMSWNEAFSRTAMFLSTLSAATVALALAGPAMAFGEGFPLFALIVLSVTLFLGLATYVRLVQVNNEDVLWVVGMNRLRGAYTRMAPGIEDNFISGWTMDPHGVSKTFGAIDVTEASPLHAFITTPAIVAVIASAIAGIMGGLLAIQVGLPMVVALVVGIVVFVVVVAAMLSYGIREYSRFIGRMRVQFDIETRPVREAGDRNG